MENIIYFGVWAAVIFLMMRFGCGAHIMGGHNHGHDHGAEKNKGGQLRWEAPEKDRDPVCGKTIRTSSAKSAVHDGSVFYFCSRECREVFEAAPDLYTGETPAGHDVPLLEHSK